ncbi:hypothetical protein Tco_0943524, partial [Tanacetum coccineum]
MAEIKTEITMDGFVTNDRVDYYLGITRITVNGKNTYELKGKFLDDLLNNAFSGTNREDAIEHIDYFLKIVDLIKLPNLKFNSIKDAKKLLEVIEKRFGRNAATKKTQRILLKQQYENFTTPSSKMLDQTFDRLQKLVSQNKADLETMRMDDLYNNLKVYEPEVKGMSSSSSSTQNMAFVSSSSNNTSSTNKAVNTARVVSTASTQVNVANSTNIDNLSDAVICAFFASQPNSPQLVNEDFHMLKSFNMEDLEDLYKLVKSKFKSTRPVEDLDLLLWGDFKTKFEPHVEDKVWKNQQEYK